MEPPSVRRAPACRPRRNGNYFARPHDFSQSANHQVNLFVDGYAAFPSSMIEEQRFALTFRGFRVPVENLRIDGHPNLPSGAAYATFLRGGGRPRERDVTRPDFR
jgi:hypothetical protein